jgi:iron complex outermembrane receptor protein
VKVFRGGGQFQHLSDRGQGDLWLGHQDKTFGARGYYGVSDSLKAEERTQDTMLLGSWQGMDPGAPYSASILLRQFEDDYKLWLPSGLFRNQHTTRTAATQVSRLFLLQENFRVQTRLAADIEDIDSDNLGDFDRSRLAVTVLPQMDVTDYLTVSAGVRSEVLEGASNYLLPLARVDVALREDLVFHVEASQSIRRPSYTELNYESPGSLGNSGLDIQEQTSYEAGLTWDASPQTRVQALAFQHRTKDTVDWIRPDAKEPRWLAENIGDVDTLGTELILTHDFHPRFKVLTSYMWMEKDADNPPFASRYSLDYARHFVRAQIDWTLRDWLRLELSQWYRDQEENALRTEGGNKQWLSNIALHFRCPKYSAVQFSLMASNATDDDYRIFPGQNTVTQRRVSAGVTLDW